MEKTTVRRPRKPTVRRPKIINSIYIIKLITANVIDAYELNSIIKTCEGKMVLAKKQKLADLIKEKANIEAQIENLQKEK